MFNDNLELSEIDKLQSITVSGVSRSYCVLSME